jgi:integrase
LDVWIVEICYNMRPNTRAAYARQRTLILSALPQGLLLCDLNLGHIRTMDRVLRSGHAKTTCDHVLSLFSRFLFVLEARGLVEKNFVHLYRRTTTAKNRGGTPRRRPPRLTIEDCRALLKAFEGHRCYPVIVTMLLFGLRIGEVTGLQWIDLDLVARTLHVERQITRVGGGRLTPGDTKTESGGRDLPVPELVVNVYATHAARQLQELNALPNAPKIAAMFRTERGNVLSDVSFRAVLDRRFPGLQPHDLRRACASHIMSLGFDRHVVGTILGHKPKTITEEYAAPTQAIQRAALEAWARVLFQLEAAKEIEGVA